MNMGCSELNCCGMPYKTGFQTECVTTNIADKVRYFRISLQISNQFSVLIGTVASLHSDCKSSLPTHALSKRPFLQEKRLEIRDCNHGLNKCSIDSFFCIKVAIKNGGFGI